MTPEELAKIKETLSDCSVENVEKMRAAILFVNDIDESWPKFSIEFPDYAKETAIVKVGNDTIGQFSFDDFPQSTKALISREVMIWEKFRGKGYGRRLNSLRIKAASLAGYEKIFATVVDSNIKEVFILETNGWRKLTSWNSYNGTTSLWERGL